MKIIKHKHRKPLKSSEKTRVLNVFNKFKRIYELWFKQTRFPYTSKRTLHRSVLAVLGTCICHKHLAPMAEGYITQFLFTLANQRLTKAHGFVDIGIVVPPNLVYMHNYSNRTCSYSYNCSCLYTDFHYCRNIDLT